MTRKTAVSLIVTSAFVALGALWLGAWWCGQYGYNDPRALPAALTVFALVIVGVAVATCAISRYP